MDLRDAGVGKPRFQSRISAKRTLYLCDECFKGLRADQLHDLFLRLGIPVGSDQRGCDSLRSAVKS